MSRRRSVSEIISENTSRKLLEVSWPEKPEGVSKKNTAAKRPHANAKTTTTCHMSQTAQLEELW
jgi:hypothetical protein